MSLQQDLVVSVDETQANDTGPFQEDPGCVLATLIALSASFSLKLWTCQAGRPAGPEPKL